MQKAAIEEVEKETQKFVKMVRIVRGIHEDQETTPYHHNKDSKALPLQSQNQSEFDQDKNASPSIFRTNL